MHGRKADCSGCQSMVAELQQSQSQLTVNVQFIDRLGTQP